MPTALENYCRLRRELQNLASACKDIGANGDTLLRTDDVSLMLIEVKRQSALLHQRIDDLQSLLVIGVGGGVAAAVRVTGKG